MKTFTFFLLTVWVAGASFPPNEQAETVPNMWSLFFFFIWNSTDEPTKGTTSTEQIIEPFEVFL